MGMLRLTYRFAAYARGLAQDAFLELRTRFSYCTLAP